MLLPSLPLSLLCTLLLFVVASSTHPEEVFLLPGLYSGLTNQRYSFYHAVLLSTSKNWTLVLPSWKFGYNDYVDGLTLPFEYFYSIDNTALSREPALSGFRFASEMPKERLGACLTQLQCSSFNDCKYPTLPIMEGRARAHKVVCLDSDSSYYTVKGIAEKLYASGTIYSLPALQALRRAMVIQPMFTDIARTISHRAMKTFGTRSFVSVHLRVEPDFLELCSKAARESWMGSAKLACNDGEAAIYEKLVALQIPFGTLLMVMNGVKEDYFGTLPTLCGSNECRVTHQHGSAQASVLPSHCKSFVCVRKEQFWGPAEAPAGFLQHDNSLSMVDFALAYRASLFLGNMYSTMSQELFHTFTGEGRKAEMYNRPCGGFPGKCP